MTAMKSLSLPSLFLFLTLSLPALGGEWTISTFAGNGHQGGAGDGGPATAAQVDNPFGVVRGPDGAIWFCEYTGQRIRRVAPDGTISTRAGSSRKGYTGDGGPALEATFNLPHEIRFDAAGNYYIADMSNHAIRKVDGKTGIISTYAGTGQAGYAGDGGAATQAQLKQPHSIQFGPEGDLYICDIGNHRVRKVDLASGVISTFAGTGEKQRTPDGAPIDGTPLNGPRALEFDGDHSLYLALREGNAIYRIDLKTHTLEHLAGTGKQGYAGDGGPAREALLSGPKGVALGPDGSLYLADTESHTIRVLRADTGVIETVVGNGSKGNGPDGDPRRCRLDRPHGVFVAVDGAVYIGDSNNHCVRRLRP